MGNTVTVFNEAGQLGEIPAENLEAAIREGGYEQAIAVTDPNGVPGSVPQSKLRDALAGGFTLGRKGAPTPAGLQGPASAPPAPVAPAAPNPALTGAIMIGHAGQDAARAYTGVLKGAVAGITGAVSDLLDPNK